MSFRFLAAVLLLLSSITAHAATHNVRVFSFNFEPKNLTIQPGDTVVWRNESGAHNVRADDGSFGNAVSASLWTFTRTFNTPGEVGYFCQPHGGPNGEGMSGKIIVAGSTPTFTIGYGITGTWYNPATTGSGFFIEALPSLNNQLVMSWFTWTGTAGVQDWFTGIGPYSGDTATLPIQHTTGGRFNDPAPVVTTDIGSLILRFTDCNNGTATFTRNDTGQTGTFPIQRLTPQPTTCVNPTQ